ncbi:glycoside hydrolase family 3 N-terminal domain-containing protein [Rhodohalobacter halophilus]|uniref:glycoside hydrolase family 3 N-terminal domain-containing protein n=1 Tax=Rhodohalobacter halophilus TaxID=1812810 RepID=UPI0009FFDD58|nr:glycoside hydrolase family 3 N-terminal domain-containing protein [Rhodohalobacter halophilus]
MHKKLPFNRIQYSRSFYSFLILLSSVALFSSCKSTELQETRPVTLPELKSPEPIDRESVMTYTDVDVDSLIQTMSLDEKIGQLFVVPAYGRFTNDKDPGFLRLKRLIENYHIGGIIFMQGDVYGQAMLTNTLQSISDIPLWISQDMEFGAAMRVSGTTRITPAMGIAATGNPENSYLKGKITAREAKALGVHQIFAPVLDVNNNPENPVINVRSFSADPKMVAEYGHYMIQGIQSEGLLATAKHFPGHGDTDTDSHLALPIINHDFARIDSLELYPFRVNINNGLRSVMSAHIAYPNMSPNGDLPGTMDPFILNDILRDSLNFDGLIVTDGLEMKGISDHYSPGEAVIKALQAGADMMLISPDAMGAIDEIHKAVDRGELSPERIDHSVRKILELKKEHGAFDTPSVDLDRLAHEINTPEYQNIANRIARQSVTLLKEFKDLLPIRETTHQKVLAVALADDESGSTGSTFARELRKYHDNVAFHVLDRRTGQEEIADILQAADEADLIIIGSFIYVRSHQPIQVQPEQLQLLRQIISRPSPSVLVAFGNPYVVRDLPNADAHVMAWSANTNQVRQTVPALFGASDITGTLPIRIPGMYDIGDGIQKTQSIVRQDSPESVGMSTEKLLDIDRVMQEAINDSVFPGGVVGVMKNGVMVWNQGYGYHDYEKTRSVQPGDIYDLASLTKVVATTTAVMKLVDEGRIDVDDPVSKYISEFDTDEKREITIEQLLIHTSGLPAFQVYVDELKTREEIIHAVRNEPLINKPGEEYVYSDLGFILLAEIVEEVSGMRIDQFVRSQLFYPMGMKTTVYNPKKIGGWLSNRIPPTEIDTTYRNGAVRAEAHDERAWFMDGVAGHAGLFSSAADIGKYAYMMLNGGVYGGREYLRSETIHYFTEKRSPINQRAFGFDRKSEGFSTAGELTGPNSFGHTGFTGTSLWIDPDEEIAIILLTNRTYPNRSYGSTISRVRATIADTVMRAINKE